MRCLRTTAYVFAFLAACPVARAAYPAPGPAGFHHCALIYERGARTATDLAPYVAYDRNPAWLFDAFLFLIQKTGSGGETQYGQTNKADWEYQLDRWFAPGRDLAALDEAVESAAGRLGSPPRKRQIMLSIPYIHRGMKQFGLIDGRPTDLSTPEGRDTAVRWYVSESARRFAAAGYRHLQLWGFYWMREDIPEEDVALVRAASDIVHNGGFRMLWIPCNGDTGIERWKRAGVDVAIYQPNYAFGTWQNGGRIGRDRIAATAERARLNGLGVEIEAYRIDTSAADRRVFAQYLADGAVGRFGYQAAATGYYLGTETVENTSRSTDPAARKSYDLLARYVSNQPVPDPDAPIIWRWSTTKGNRTAEARFASPRKIAAVEIFLNRARPTKWEGLVEVSVRRPGARTWAPGGWAIRGHQAQADAGPGWICIPVGGEATAVRVAFRPAAGAGPLSLASISIDPNDTAGARAHLALGSPYTIEPTHRGKYADTGRMLTDGITQGGFQAGRTVGWMASGRSAAVSFDLGRAIPVSEVQAFVQGGGVGAVYTPTSAVALFAADGAPPAASEGRGGLPKGFALVSGGGLKVDLRRSPNDVDGHITFRPGKPARSRYVTLIFQAEAWLMLSEVKILVNGRNVAPSARYTLYPLAGAAGEEPDAAYADDGARLTDGVVAEDFSPRQLTGWRDNVARTITIGLQRPRRVNEVTVWTLRGGGAGIYAPAEVRAESSVDGTKWVAMGESRPIDRGELNRTEALACRIRVAAPQAARFVRVRAAHSREWAMLSEIEVN